MGASKKFPSGASNGGRVIWGLSGMPVVLCVVVGWHTHVVHHVRAKYIILRLNEQNWSKIFGEVAIQTHIEAFFLHGAHDMHAVITNG